MSHAWAAAAGGSILMPVDGPRAGLSIVKSKTPIFYLHADQGVTDDPGVSTWTDLSGQGKHATAAGGARPSWQANQIFGHHTVRGDGAAHSMNFAGLDLPAPGTTPTWFLVWARFLSWTSGDALFSGSGTTTMRVRQGNATPQIAANNGTVSNNNAAAVLNTLVRIECLFSNTAADYLKVGGTPVSSTVTTFGNGNAASGAFWLFSGNAANFANVEILLACAYNGDPTGDEKSKLDKWGTRHTNGALVIS